MVLYYDFDNDFCKAKNITNNYDLLIIYYFCEFIYNNKNTIIVFIL